MTRASSAEDGCRQAEALALLEAAGERLSADQSESLETHRAECPGCRSLVAAAGLLRDTDGEGPAGPLDELASHRMVSDVVSQLAELDATPTPRTKRAATKGRFGRYRLAVAAAVLLLLGAGLGAGIHRLLLRPRGKGTPQSPTAGRPTGRVHLSAGQVSLNDAPAKVGLAVRTGHLLRVSGGRAVLGLPGSAAVLVENDSALRVQRLEPRATTLHLKRGKVLASVRPRPGRPYFTVVTAAGRVEVTGTVFSVEHTPRGVSVAVLRGQVRVHEHGRPSRLVGRGMQTVMRAANGPGSSARRKGSWPLDANTQAEAWAQVRVLDLIHAKRAAKVTLQSRPAGALVFVDGLLMGQTPLVTRLRAGHHRILLRKVGHRPAEKQLHAAEGADSTWDVTLESAFVTQRAGLAPTTGPDPATTTARKPAPRVKAPALLTKPGSPGHAVAPTPPAEPTSPPAPTAKELAQRARTQRGARNWRGAAATFAELIRRYPTSGWARTARVSLGMIQLDRLGNARGALAQFSAYLASTRVGALAQEASYGRIRALRRLGRRAAEIRLLQSFLKLYPRAIQTGIARRRLKKLGIKVPPPAMQHMGLGAMSGVK